LVDFHNDLAELLTDADVAGIGRDLIALVGALDSAICQGRALPSAWKDTK
jgi:hypothetical protein